MRFREAYARRLAGFRRRLRGSNGSPFRDEGKAAGARGDWPAAVTAYRQHLRIRPHDCQTWLRLANALKDWGKLEEAETAYAEACRRSPESADAWLNRGHLAKMDGRLQDALDHYARSFKIDGRAATGRELNAIGGAPRWADSTSTICGSVDGIVGRMISGWAVDPDHPGTPAQIEFVQGGEVVGEATANLTRADVFAAGFGSLKAGFRAKLGSDYRPSGGAVTARLSSSKKPLENSPYLPCDGDVITKWLERHNRLTGDDINSIQERNDAETSGFTLSILMPVYKPRVTWLVAAIDSVRTQLCSRWELICIDDGSDDAEITDVLAQASAQDQRIKIVRMTTNVGIASATNAGLSQATGNYVAFMDHDDILEPEAVYRMLDAAYYGADLIYSDEVVVGSEIDEIIDIVARPAFSYDYYLSHPYFVHFVSVKTSLARAVGGLDVHMPISMDVDFILRVIEQANVIAHVPVPLYRWRTHSESTGHGQVGAVMEATKDSLRRHHDRVGHQATVVDGKTFNSFRTDFYDHKGRVLAIIPTKNRLDLLRPCVESVLATTGDDLDIVVIDHESDDLDLISYLENLPSRVRVMAFSGSFNFSRMNNLAVAEFGVSYEFALFLNNDIEAIEPGWLEHMRGLCQRRDVGVVGALLLYGDDRVQHGGVVMGVGGPAEHVYKAEPYDLGAHVNPGHISGLVSVRDYMAVTGACLMMRTEVFQSLNGFDEMLAVGFNDIDLCLRARQQGYRVLFDGHAVLRHHESATRSVSKQLKHPEDTDLMASRWADLLSRPDPYFSPLFGREAPARHAVVEPIDVHAPLRVWRRHLPLTEPPKPPRRIAAPTQVP